MSNHDHDNQSLSSFEGERAIPNVNEGDGRPSALRGLIVILLLLFVALAGGLAYWKTQQKIEKSQKQKDIAISAPSRTFSEPPPPAIPEPEKQEKETVIVAPPAPPPELTEPHKEPPKLDKSISNMMAGSSATGNNHNAATAQNGSTNGTTTNPAAIAPTSGGALSGSLTSTDTPKRVASFIGNRNFILAKGSFIDCALQTRLDSTVAGMTACVVTRNIYSDNGKVLLVERGSTVSGEYQGNIKQGQARIGVLWNRIKTPKGVVISLDSLGTDALGGAGVTGYIDTHFWERFGAAIMLSLIDDAASFAANGGQGSGNGSGNRQQQFNFGNSAGASQDMATEALKSSVNIPPTLYKNQGEQVGIYVARDLDFSSVYDVTAK